jgi:hypothetical protein
MSLEKAKEIIFNNLPVEIFLGHNAIGTYIAISEHAEFLNKSRFTHAFGLIQQHAHGAFILSLCKLFEKPNSRFPNLSIPTAICYLREQLASLASLKYDCIKFEKFIQDHIDNTFEMASQSDIERIPSLILRHFDDTCPQTPPREGYVLDHELDAMKVLRDKRVAHPEDCKLDGMSKTDLDGALSLLVYAQTFVNICGYGFFGFSRESVATLDQFEPSRSEAWSQLSKIIKTSNNRGRKRGRP